MSDTLVGHSDGSILLNVSKIKSAWKRRLVIVASVLPVFAISLVIAIVQLIADIYYRIYALCVSLKRVW